MIVTEFSVDYRWIEIPGFTDTPYWALDKNGIGLHESLWSSALSGTSISAMSWWWDVQIEKYSLFYHFKAFSTFLKGVDLVKSGLKEVSVIVKEASTERGEIASIILYSTTGWVSTT